MVKIKERRGMGAIETIEQQSMKRNEYFLNNVMLLEIPLWRS